MIQPLLIEIYDQSLIDHINQKSKNLNLSPLQYILTLIQNDVEKVNATEIVDGKEIVSLLFKIYQEEYKKKFNVPAPYENGETQKLCEAAVTRYVNEGMKLKDIYEKLAGAIVWYINFHDNTNSAGQNFPYGLKYLFSKTNDSWLLRSCIESSLKLNDNVFKLMQQGMSRDEALRAFRRGEGIKNNNKQSRAGKSDAVIKLFMEVYKQVKNKDAMKKSPKFVELFKTEIPDDKYLDDAILFLNYMKSKLKENDE